MENNTRIFWFSGTGNSLYAAKILAAELAGARLIKITGEEPKGAVGAAGGRVGFVFPSYYGNLPRAVNAFVEKLVIEPDAYVFAIVTMGGLGQGSVNALYKALKKKGTALSYGRCVHMPENYIIMYNPADPEKCAITVDKSEKLIRAAAKDIAAGIKSVKKLPLTAKSLYKNIDALDAGFTVGDGCNGCGVCERVCPVGNVALSDGKPEWLHRCERCVACINWCPTQAIDFGEETKSRRRYHNPYINVDEIAGHDA